MRQELRKTIKFLAEYLESVARITPALPEVGPPRQFSIVINYGKTRYCFKTLQHPAHIKARADRLRREQRAMVADLPAEPQKRPSLRRSGYSKKVAETFAADGELDNLKAYNELWDK
jgi:hypothetical protein